MGQEKPSMEQEVIDKLKPRNIREIMTYLGSDSSAREKMLNNGSVTPEEAEYLNSLPEAVRHNVLVRIFSMLQGEDDEAA